MVFFLYGHKQQVQHMCRTNASSRFSPKYSATKTLLLLENVLAEVFCTVTAVTNEMMIAVLREAREAALKESTVNDRLFSLDVTIALLSLSQTTAGILGNVSLLYRYLFLCHTQSRSRTTDLILQHLTLANSLVILSKGVPHTVAALGLKYFLRGFACELLFCVHRVGRGVSIGSTCLLSVFQTIMISPTHSCWKGLKAPKIVHFCIVLFWIQNMFLNSINPIYVLHVSSTWSKKNITKFRDWGFCFTTDREQITGLIHTVLIVVPEVSFSVIITWASGSMVFILYRHSERVQHIHGNQVSPRSSAESTATQRILVLMSTFLSSYALSSISHVCIALFLRLDWWVMNISALISLCFPTISPYLFMSHRNMILGGIVSSSISLPALQLTVQFRCLKVLALKTITLRPGFWQQKGVRCVKNEMITCRVFGDKCYTACALYVQHIQPIQGCSYQKTMR
ncbi:vomeronasal type-1 receptor 4-like [Phacochoerus africanus]|uniref:vomeronasal type-1 receptor 4-like n=1 Tax=Phacochoerus africanus TaxID=41426 RepID=UPI001FDA8A8E|nr:vomeronasal type-1 receptor 4-like [Phacochoerus africanus]